MDGLLTALAESNCLTEIYACHSQLFRCLDAKLLARYLASVTRQDFFYFCFKMEFLHKISLSLHAHLIAKEQFHLFVANASWQCTFLFMAIKRLLKLGNIIFADVQQLFSLPVEDGQSLKLKLRLQILIIAIRKKQIDATSLYCSLGDGIVNDRPTEKQCLFADFQNNKKYFHNALASQTVKLKLLLCLECNKGINKKGLYGLFSTDSSHFARLLYGLLKADQVSISVSLLRRYVKEQGSSYQAIIEMLLCEGSTGATFLEFLVLLLKYKKHKAVSLFGLFKELHTKLVLYQQQGLFPYGIQPLILLLHKLDKNKN